MKLITFKSSRFLSFLFIFIVLIGITLLSFFILDEMAAVESNHERKSPEIKIAPQALSPYLTWNINLSCYSNLLYLSLFR